MTPQSSQVPVGNLAVQQVDCRPAHLVVFVSEANLQATVLGLLGSALGFSKAVEKVVEYWTL